MSEFIEAFLRDHPYGSLVRSDDVPVPVFIEVMEQGYLAQLPDSGFGYPLTTYLVIQPNGQTEL